MDRALNNRSGIKEATKQRILETARQMNYQPNQLASALAKGRSQTLGVVCINLKNNFFSILMEEIERYAKEQGYFISLILSHNNSEKELEGIRYFENRQVDGLIVFPSGTDKTYEAVIQQLKTPIVTIYNRISKDIVHIDMDGYSIMKHAVRDMKDRGYERIIYMDCGNMRRRESGVNTYSLFQRRLGYLKGIEEVYNETGMIMEEFDEVALIDYAKDQSKRTGILCPYDNMAIRVLNVLTDNGISVPGQIGIRGFDNIDLLNVIRPRLCSVDCEVEILGRAAVDRIIELIHGKKDVEDTIVGYRLTEGETL